MIARMKAFGVHFSLSVCVIAVFLFAVFYIWYPYPFYEFYSTWDVIKIVAGVDVILGPLLTFVVFNKIKKPAELKRDLSIIVLFQLVALFWGVHITYSARPVFLVFSNGTFFSFSKNELDMSKLKHKQLAPSFYESPTLVYLKPPKDSAEYRQIIMDMAENRSPDLIYRTNRYLPIADYWQKIYHYSLTADEINNNKQGAELADAFIKNRKRNPDDFAFYRMRSGKATATLVIDKKADKIAGLINSRF